MFAFYHIYPNCRMCEMCGKFAAAEGSDYCEFCKCSMCSYSHMNGSTLCEICACRKVKQTLDAKIPIRHANYIQVSSPCVIQQQIPVRVTVPVFQQQIPVCSVPAPMCQQYNCIRTVSYVTDCTLDPLLNVGNSAVATVRAIKPDRNHKRCRICNRVCPITEYNIEMDCCMYHTR